MEALNRFSSTAAILIGLNPLNIGSILTTTSASAVEPDPINFQLIYCKKESLQEHYNTNIAKHILSKEDGIDTGLHAMNLNFLVSSIHSVKETISLDNDFINVLNLVTSKVGKDRPSKLRF